MPISFGTDGWRGIMGQDFTIENLEIVTQAVADYFRSESQGQGKIFIGFDTRMNSQTYALKTAQVLQANNLNVEVSARPLPTPLLSFAVKKYQGIGGIMITASHNPPEFNGMKIKGAYGGSATPEIIKKIEKFLYHTKPKVHETNNLQYFDPTKDYFEHLQSIVNFNLLSRLPGPILIDPMYGSATGYLSGLLQTFGTEVSELHAAPNPTFNGTNPEPIEENLSEIMDNLKKGEGIIGLALDGDGDRVGLINQFGEYISSQQVYLILLNYLVKYKGWQGGVVKTFSTTDIIKKITDEYGLPYFETPIGFKYICDHFLKEDILMGGEESGGFGFKNHLPERDGILSSLLLLESLIVVGSIHEQLENIHQKYGATSYHRIDCKAPQNLIKSTLDRFLSSPPSQLGEEIIVAIQTLDGVKIRFTKGWLLLRPSGTEPLVRIYSEGQDMDWVMKMCQVGQQLFT